ncbi:MAG: hypothetical protein KF703_11860 [Actinobacteria bacterium]|nr:hypothetical protein [Actinomycetota bacterium]
MTRGPLNPARAALVGVAAAVLALAACSSDGSDGATTTSSTATSTTSARSTTTAADDTSTTAPGSTTTGGGGTTVPTTSPDGETTPGLGTLPEGPHYGYFTGVSDGMVEGDPVQVVAFDPVELLTGQDAVDAAIAHGDAEPGATSIDNDYYIVNDDTSLLLLPVIPEGVVSVIREGSSEPQPGSIDEAVTLPTLYKVEIVAPRGISLITATEGVYLP